jgi:hypothetical protein
MDKQSKITLHIVLGLSVVANVGKRLINGGLTDVGSGNFRFCRPVRC